jgi:hypothetical protein
LQPGAFVPLPGFPASASERMSQPPPATTDLLLVVEDIDAPIPSPPSIPLHALTRPDSAHPSTCRRVPLAGKDPAAGVRVLRSGVGRRASGVATTALSRSRGMDHTATPSRLFALFSGPDQVLHGSVTCRTGPRAYLASITAPVTARGRLTGVYER